KRKGGWSGAEKGSRNAREAPSIRGVELSRSRNQSSLFPSTTASNAMRRPSGETAVEGGLPGWKISLSGSGKNSLVTRGGSSRKCFQASSPSVASATDKILAMAHGIFG